MPVREPIGVYPIRQVLQTGGPGQPWVGMRDARETSAQQPDKVLLAQNLYLSKGGGGRAYTARPGFTPWGANFPADVQWSESWYRPSGVVVSLAVAGGAIYRYDWTAQSWVLAVNQATTGLATTGRVQFIPFAGGIVVNDRVNRPRFWNGTDGGGITVLSNAPVAWWGWVQSAKLVFINAANRLEIQWSEEADPNTGYAAGGFNNAWELRQLGNAPLTAGIGRNGGMVVFRERSTFTILGEITTDFQSASTRSDVSDVIGTLSPWALCATDSGIVFLDADARPFLLPAGGAPEPLWPDCVEQLSAQLVPRNQLLRAITLEDRAVGELLIGLPSTTSSQITTWLAFDRDTLGFEGVWPIMADHAGMVVTDANEPRWVHTSGATAYLHGAPGIGPWSDFLRVGVSTVETAVPHTLECPVLGRDLTESLFVDSIEVGLSASQVSRVTVTGETPDGVLPALEVPLSIGSGARLGAFVLDTDRLGSVSRDRRVMVGQDGYGRWVRPIIRHAERGEPISITDVRVVVFKDDAVPDTV
jgi:hypothetical protein